MKKTIEIENKIIVIFHGNFGKEKINCDTFEEAYETMKNKYTNEDGIVGWDIEEWNETFDFEEAKGKFEAYDYVGFCDDDKITTIEQFLNETLDEML